ncbi:hypothetical protein [Chthonobacter albigriseus]|uniref:hypothetical protein n=1 Tax=Chthonobacter albigriseus TaxID=1683161 RepID=UPI0015EF59ED|nr:hypothetical protein [Chthonobacter albigriseus]
MGKLASLLVVLTTMVTAAAAQEPAVAELVSAFANGKPFQAKTFSGLVATFILLPDGTALLSAPDKAWKGRWAVRAEAFCLRWEEQAEKCFVAEIDGRVATIFHDGEPVGTWTR